VRAALAALALAAALGAAPLAAADDGGQPAAWARLPLGARASALGQAVSAIDGDVSAAEQNPALLATQTRIGLASQASLLPDGRSLEYLGLARPMDRDGDWGWGAHCAWYSDTGYERRATNSPTPDGSFDGSALLLQGGLGGWVWRRKVAVGVAAKLLSQGLADASASGGAFDLGAFCAAAPWLDLGVAAQDLFGHLGWSTGLTEALPPRGRAGLRLKTLDGVFALSLEAVMEADQGVHALAGLEWWLLPGHLALRGGLQDGQPSLGLGAQGRFFGLEAGLDYSAGAEAGAGDQLQQRLSLDLGFDL
jgi:hypothetical protein